MCQSTMKSHSIALCNYVSWMTFISVVMQVVDSRVLMELNMSRQAEQTSVEHGLAAYHMCANSDILVC
jgi:hypothetical protein